jgi:hypothetical protein
MPEGVGAPADRDVTIAVNVTGSPKLDGFEEELTLVVDPLA